MIRMKDIKKSINMKIFSAFNRVPTSKDISEGFDRPSFFVEISGKKKDLGVYFFQRNIKIIIYYFPEVQDFQDVVVDTINQLLEVQEDLETVFDCNLQVGDRSLNIEESEGDIIDGVLQFSFEMTYIDTKDYEEAGVLADEIKIRKDV